jgi:hypothetical protein
MSYLKEIVIIVFSFMMGASYSTIITVLMNRRISNPLFNIFYSIRVHGLIILCLIVSLLIIYLYTKNKKLSH